MGLDRTDGVALVGIVLLAGSATVLETIVVAAALGGFLLSLSVWRLYGGHPWEALGWFVWVGTAVTVVVDPGGVAFLVAFVVTGVLGTVLLLGGRSGLLVDVWTVDGTDGEEASDG